MRELAHLLFDVTVAVAAFVIGATVEGAAVDPPASSAFGSARQLLVNCIHPAPVEGGQLTFVVRSHSLRCGSAWRGSAAIEELSTEARKVRKEFLED